MIPRLFLSLALILAVAVASGVPQGRTPTDGVLRLNWKTEGEKLRIKTDVNDENLPVHMRTQVDYEEKIRTYRLKAIVDGKPWLDKVMQPLGFHHDRPISVYEELNLPPGKHHVHLSFLPEPDDGATWKPELDQSITIEPGAILTLTVGDPPSTGESSESSDIEPTKSPDKEASEPSTK